jgi:hypothetical protein
MAAAVETRPVATQEIQTERDYTSQTITSTLSSETSHQPILGASINSGVQQKHIVPKVELEEHPIDIIRPIRVS